MAEPAHSTTFDQAINVTPLDSHTYSAHLDKNWCIGLVPHGGYTAAVIYRAAKAHFKTTHAARFKSSPEPIGFQISYLRRTTIGPAIIKVEDIKLGARISTIHLTLSQRPDNAKDDDNTLEVKVAAYITASPPETETGPAILGTWDLSPAPVPGSLDNGAVDFGALVRDGQDGDWAEYPRATHLTAPRNLELYGPRRPVAIAVEERATSVVDQWARFTPGGRLARWSNEAVMFLVDMFPAALDRMAAMEALRMAAAQEGGKGEDKPGQFWYPTVTMNVDLKTRIPESGVEWVYSRVVSRVMRGSRADVDVVLMDQDGNLVGTSSQVVLVVDASRNFKGRQVGGKL